MAEFKKISDVDVIEELTENDNVLVIGSDGALRQTSSANLGMDITKTEVVEAPEETDNLVLVSNGIVKQIPAVTFAAASGGGGVEPIYLFTTSTDGSGISGFTLLDGSDVPNNLYDLFLAGTPIFKNCQVYNEMSDTSWTLCVSAAPCELTFGNNDKINLCDVE
jgi:hypothetical protein